MYRGRVKQVCSLVIMAYSWAKAMNPVQYVVI